MPPKLERVVVLGAGTMGARLAAHCANHGLTTTLLDVTPERAAQGLGDAAKARPAAFFLPEMARRVQTGGFAEAMEAAARADWVIEAVVEDLAIKRELLAGIAPRLREDVFLTSNTSGLPIGEVGAGLPAALQERWMGTHFFNPPRYMQLVEMIPGEHTRPEALAWLGGELERRLGKGVVMARDTPNFIANRIGVFSLLQCLRKMQESGLSLEEVDARTGPLLGWPKSATFRTLDIIGIDTLAHVIRNSRERLPHDEARELFVVPPYIEQMLARGWLGEKSGQGFYRRQGELIEALDLATMTYRPRRRVSLAYPDMHSAMRHDAFVRECLEGLFAYVERRLGEITDSAEDMDQAMRWGYNWQYGPFELRRISETGKLPVRALGAAVRSNPGCSLVDLGDGIGGLEFHSKMNVIGGDTVAMVTEALTEPENRFEGFVVTNGAENFSAGADLAYLLALIQNEEWDEVEEAVVRFQRMNMAVKRCPVPVVVAPAGLTLGGGCEMTLHGAQAVAHAELYAGLVEVGAGLIPAGGGTKEMALRTDSKTAFETIALAKVSSSAAEARKLRFLQRGDRIVAHRGHVLGAAKQAARALAEAGYEAPMPAVFKAPGPSVESTLRLGAYLMAEGEQISAFERKLADKLIHVLCAGGAPAGKEVSEERLLELEREAFLSLCGEPKTQERIAHLLKTGKALRN